MTVDGAFHDYVGSVEGSQGDIFCTNSGTGCGVNNEGIHEPVKVFARIQWYNRTSTCSPDAPVYCESISFLSRVKKKGFPQELESTTDRCDCRRGDRKEIPVNYERYTMVVFLFQHRLQLGVRLSPI